MDAKLMEAIAAYQAGRPDQAEKLFQERVRRRPNDVDARRMIGFLCNQMGRHAEAVEHCDLVLRLNRKQPQIHYLRGISCLALKRFQDALDSFDAALAIDGPQADTYVNRGVALQRLERLGEAIESYDRAITLDPFYVLAHTNKAAALEDQGKHQEALASYDNSLKVQPTSDAWWGRSTVLQLMKRYDEALFALKQAYALEPSRPYLQGAILNLKMQLGDWDNFAQECELVLKGVDKGLAVAMPGCTLLLPSNPEQQRRAAEIYTRDKFPAQPAPPPPPHRPPHTEEGKVGAEEGRERVARAGAKPKITIGYFSCDFHNHPLSQLTAGVVVKHHPGHFSFFCFPSWARRGGGKFGRGGARAVR